MNEGPNGVMRMWLDGAMTHDYTDLRYMFPGESGTFSQVMLWPIWGGSGDTVDEEFYMYIDHSYMSTSN